MAVRRYYCSWRGCKTLLDCAGYCDKHKELAQERDRIRQQKRQDMFAHARRTNLAYYRTKQWRILRQRILQACPRCRLCGSSESLHVDHIQPPRGDAALFFDGQNLQVLCERCHRLKTASEINARRSKDDIRQFVRRYVIG